MFNVGRATHWAFADGLEVNPKADPVCVFNMDVLSNGLSISAKKDSQLLCCIMGKRCHLDVTFWLLMVGDW